MTSRPTPVEGDRSDRSRVAAALLRGDSLDLDPVPTRPGAPLALGVVVALLVTAAAAVGGSLAGRAPDGWDADGTLVVDEATGARFVVDGGVLRPAPTLTSALLAGARPDPVQVPHDVVADAPVGADLPGEDVPASPPVLPPTPTGFTACTSAGAVEVHADAPLLGPAPEQGLLVSTPGSDQVRLLAAGRSHPLTQRAVDALGYAASPVREVPTAWAALVATGEPLDLLAVPAVDAARGVEGVGAGGEVVAASGSGRRYLVDDGTLRPLADRTSELLAPAPARSLPDPVLAAAPAGEPFGLPGAPEEPPPVPSRGTAVVPCARSSDGLVVLASSVRAAGTRPTTTRTLALEPEPVVVTWHFAPGRGALVGPLGLAGPRAPGDRGTGGIVVVADGTGHDVVDDAALRALGYRRDQTVLLPDPWLRLLARGGDLALTA